MSCGYKYKGVDGQVLMVLITSTYTLCLLKMGSIAPNFAPQNLPTETIFPRGWVRYLYTFELPEDYDMNAVADIFRRGYQAAKKRSPMLGCEAVPDFASKPPGMWKLREYGDEIEDFTVKICGTTPTFRASRN